MPKLPPSEVIHREYQAKRKHAIQELDKKLDKLLRWRDRELAKLDKAAGDNALTRQARTNATAPIRRRSKPGW